MRSVQRMFVKPLPSGAWLHLDVKKPGRSGHIGHRVTGYRSRVFAAASRACRALDGQAPISGPVSRDDLSRHHS